MKDYGKLDFSTSFNPTSGFPLDSRCEFDTYEAALAAAQTAGEVGNKTSKYYYGMVLTVHGDTVKKYVIQSNQTLEPLGSGEGSGECDWNKMKNKPFDSSFRSEAGSAPIPPDTSIEFQGKWYRIIDTALTEEQLLKSTVTLSLGANQILENVRITEEMLNRSFAPIGLLIMAKVGDQIVAILVAYTAGDFPIDDITVTIPAVGIYFAGDADAWQPIELAFDWEDVKTLDPIFLPMDAIDARIDAYLEEALGGDY